MFKKLIVTGLLIACAGQLLAEPCCDAACPAVCAEPRFTSDGACGGPAAPCTQTIEQNGAAQAVPDTHWQVVKRSGNVCQAERGTQVDSWGWASYCSSCDNSCEYVRVRYGLDAKMCRAADGRQKAIAALQKAIEAFDKNGITGIGKLMADAHIVVPMRTMVKHFDRAFSRTLRGDRFKVIFAGLAGIGLLYAGLKMLHKPVANITERAGRVSAALLGGGVAAGLGAVAKATLRSSRVQDALSALLACPALIVGGDEREIEHTLAHIVKRLD